MCGVAGFVQLDGRTPCPVRLRRMGDAVALRGPDDAGHEIHGAVGLAHRRLSIQDTSAAGHQPMMTGDKLHALSFNGEIYNARALASDMVDPPSWRGHSDTEVLLELLARSGSSALARLNGIFAFAYLDIRRRRMLIACDAFGVKPMYVARDDQRLYFASEVKAILAGGYRPDFNPTAAIDFAFSGWSDDRATLFRGVERLSPGSLMELSLVDGSMQRVNWWDFKPEWNTRPLLRLNEEEWVDALDRRLTNAVERQLLSDVSVGSLCSGGLDSSLVSALAKRSRAEISLLNVSIPDVPEPDESIWARKVAAQLDAPLVTVNLTAADFRRELIRMVYATEMPLPFLNAVGIKLISDKAREIGIKVLLTGEGADELFGGYLGKLRPQLYRQRVAQLGGKFALSCFDAVSRTADRASELLTGLGRRDPGLPLHRLLSGGLALSDAERAGRSLYADRLEPLEQDVAVALFVQLRSYLLPILHRTDRASMAASIEARVPYLDNDLVNLALAMPTSMKFRWRAHRPVGKWALKRVAERYLPRDVVHRPKVGFGVPRQIFHIDWPDQWVKNGFLVNSFSLNSASFSRWISNEKSQIGNWALTLEIWGQLFMLGREVEELEHELAAAKADACSA
jgi:asparagine synthase (glutamine-hydrolysing)